MSVFKAFFGLGKIPQVVKFFEFQSFDDVNKMGGAIRALKEQSRMSGTQLTKAQKKYLDDQMKQVEMVFEQMQQPSTQSGIRSTKSAKIFDLQGNKIDPNKPIMGGTQEIDKAIDNASPGFAGDRKYDAQLVADDLAEKRFGKDFYDLDQKQQMSLYDEAYTGLSKQRFLDKELMKTDNPFSDLVKTTEKGPKGIKEREAEILERMNKSNKKNVGIIKRRKMREEISKVNDQIEEMIESGVDEMNPELGKLYDKQNDLELKLDFEDMMNPDPEDMAQGGRAGFKTGLGKRFLELLKPKPKPKFDVKRFREGPIDLKFLENIDKKDLAPFIRTRDTMGPGGYGMYDDFADMPAGLRAAELVKTIKTKDGGINYKAAELFLGKRLRGDESADELIQMLNRQEMRADGGRIGYDNGSKLSDFIDVQASGTKSGKQQIEGAPEGITIDSESFNAIAKADIPISQKVDLLLQYQYGKGRNKIERDGQEIFLDEGGSKNRDIGFGFNKDGEGIGGTLMYNMEKGKPEFNVRIKKSFADGGRIGLKAGMTKRAFLKLMGSTAAGIGAVKSGILSGFGKGAGKKAVEKVAINSSTLSAPPPYFFELANKIKTLGKPDKVTYADRVEIHRYRGKNGDEYELIEDLNTGDVRITKDKTGVGSYGDKTFDTIEDRSVLEYRKGDVNVKDEGLETQSSFKEADEYEEYKVEFDQDGTEAGADDIAANVQKEIIEEAGGEAPSIKKAGGGIARMLGE